MSPKPKREKNSGPKHAPKAKPVAKVKSESSTKSKKPARSKTGKRAPAHFFEKELKGETPLTLGTAVDLYNLAGEFFARSPWNLLVDQELILMRVPGCDELCYCSVMGAAGQVFALQVYLGAEGYRIFRRMASGEPMTTSELMAAMVGVQAELVPTEEATPADRKLLRTMGHFTKGYPFAPVFRSYRPGYAEWYITEEEGKILAACIDLMTAFYDVFSEAPDIDYWMHDNNYPFVSRGTTDGDGNDLKIVQLEAIVEPAPAPNPPALDLDNIARIRQRNHPCRGVVEIDHIYVRSEIGGKNERKAITHLAIAVDAVSGFAYPPVVGGASQTAGELLTSAILQAVKTSGVIPKEIRVNNPDVGSLLAHLANALGCTVTVHHSLPAFDYVRVEMERAVDDGRL